MITQIEIENFKCFKNIVSFPLGKLTLLTGVNGRGKSTLLQSLLLMKQSIEHDENTDKILLNGSCVNLNSFDRWWNPAVEDQATDRAFRIGQKKNVFVHKFITIGSLEEGATLI